VGGSAVTPVSVIAEYSSDLTQSQGDDHFAEYGPLLKLIVELGDECAALSGDGTFARVLNDGGGDGLVDSFDLVAQEPAGTGKTLFGREIDFVQFLLGDNDGTMFSSTALPTSVDFAESADFSQSLIGLIDPVGGRTVLLFNESGSVRFSVYDPAGALAAIQANLAGFQMNAGVKVSLQNKLRKAGDYINGTSSNSNAKAEQELQAFIAQVQALSGQAIATRDANRLISGATKLINQLPACS
jgi:hypothetical protein